MDCFASKRESLPEVKMDSLASGYEGLTCFSTGSSYHGAAACKTLLFQNIVEEAKHEGGQLASSHG